MGLRTCFDYIAGHHCLKRLCAVDALGQGRFAPRFLDKPFLGWNSSVFASVTNLTATGSVDWFIVNSKDKVTKKSNETITVAGCARRLGSFDAIVLIVEIAGSRSIKANFPVSKVANLQKSALIIT